MLIVVNIKQGWTNFFLGTRFLGLAILLARPIGHAKKMAAQNQSIRPIETQLETFLFALYYLNITYSFRFSCVSIKYFSIEAFVA